MTSLWEEVIFFHFTLTIEKLEGTIIFDVKEGILSSFDEWGINHITGVESAIVDFIGEDIFTLEDNFSGSVFTWLGSSGISDLAWESFNHNEGSWLKSVGIGLLAHGGTGVSILKSFVVRHGKLLFVYYQ
jgi:hypothetical protein|tara:strand:+ start:514 stop:903 length:390 start_codon:yes stop_codon:yes gene_type:complete